MAEQRVFPLTEKGKNLGFSTIDLQHFNQSKNPEAWASGFCYFVVKWKIFNGFSDFIVKISN